MAIIKTKLAKKIKELRESRNLSQSEVAKVLGLHRPAISEIERGNRDVTVEELLKLAELFHITLESLISDEPGLKGVSDPAESQEGYQIMFIRHGEAVDDIYDQYGGWADPEITSSGVIKAHQVAESLKSQNRGYKIVFTSPLLRARKTAEIISLQLNLDLRISQYLKERNTYGLLSGINKEIAKNKYSELVEVYEKGEYVLGSERYEDFLIRVGLIFEFIKREGIQNAICITHSGVMKGILSGSLGLQPQKLEDGSHFVVNMKNNELSFVESEGISFAK